MILCCGEALIDMLPALTGDGRSAYVPHTGGVIFNTAIALGRLGAPAALLTGLSRDLFGQMLEQDLHASGVDTSYAIRSDRPTTLAFVQLNGGQASYTFFDENSAGRMLREDELPELPASVEALYCGGISLVVEPGADTLAALIRRESGRRPIMVDPNIRRGFISDESRYRKRLADVIGASDIVKVSDEDLDWLAPGPSTTAEKVRSLSGPAIVVVTEGSKGASAFLEDGSSLSVPARPTKVVDTVGAGDSFNAGLLAYLSRSGALTRDGLRQTGRGEFAHALEFAHKVASVTVSRSGANPPWAAEMAEQDS